MLYVSKIIFNDGTIVNVSDIYNIKQKKYIHDTEFTVDDFLNRIKLKLPLSRNQITSFCRNITNAQRRAFLKKLVSDGVLFIEKDGKKETYHHVS